MKNDPVSGLPNQDIHLWTCQNPKCREWGGDGLPMPGPCCECGEPREKWGGVSFEE